MPHYRFLSIIFFYTFQQCQHFAKEFSVLLITFKEIYVLYMYINKLFIYTYIAVSLEVYRTKLCSFIHIDILYLLYTQWYADLLSKSAIYLYIFKICIYTR